MSPNVERQRRRSQEPHGMRPLRTLLPFDEALSLCLAVSTPIERRETVPILDSLHRVVAVDLRAPRDVPPADRAAMDGYAVLARDTARAGKSSPAVLHVGESLFADAVPTKRVGKGRCAQIATGATLPRGADAVVMVEDTDREKDLVHVFRSVHPRENVSRRGSDLRKRSLVLSRGEVLTPAKVGALAAMGRATVSVYAKPRVAILVTGDEVVPPGARLHPGQVFDINSHTLAGVVRESGGEPVVAGRVPDRLEDLREALESAADEDLVVLSGGSSVGVKDLITDALQSSGEMLFHGIAIKPGRPTILGRVRGTPVLGMPGNPTSCLSNGYVLLAPMLRQMARLPPRAGGIVEVPLATRIASPRDRVEVHTVRIVDGRAVPAFKESGAITSMSRADGYIVIPADVAAVEAGETVRVTLF